MKKIFLLILVLGYLKGFSQTPPGWTKINFAYEYVGVGTDSILIVPRYSTTPSGVRKGYFGAGQLACDTVNHIMYFYSGGSWRAIGSGGGGNNANAGSGFRWLKPATQDIKTAFGGYGILIDSTTNTNGLTFKVDTPTIQKKVLYGNDFAKTGDSTFLRGAWVNIKDYGGVDDNSTDNTNALNAAIATGKAVFIPPGGIFKFTTGVTVGDNQMIFGWGKTSRLKYTGTLRAFTLGNKSILSNFWLEGNGKASGNAFETGVLAYQKIMWRLEGLFITQFGGNPGANGGGGINVNLLASGNTEGGHIINCYVDSCKAAINMEERGEYIVITNTTCTNSDYGFSIGAGNVYATNMNVQKNTYGLYMFNGTNDGHGSLSGIAFNHNTYNQISDQEIGMYITNCGFYYGALILKNNNSIRFVNCDLGSMDSMHLEDNTAIYRIGCMVGRTTLSAEIPGQNPAFSGERFNDIGCMDFNGGTNARYFLNQINSRDSSITRGPLQFNNVPYAINSKLDFLTLDTTNGNVVRTSRLMSNFTAGNNKVFYSNGSGVVTELALPASGRVLTSTGASSAPTWENGTLNVNFTDVGNVGAGEDDLMTYSLPGGTLSADKDRLEYEMTFAGAGNANSKTIKIYFGATSYTFPAFTTSGTFVRVNGTVMRTGATTQRISIRITSDNGTTQVTGTTYLTASETLSGAVTIKATGTATNDNDIVEKMFTVNFFKSN